MYRVIIGREIKKMRKEKGLTQLELAKLINASSQSIKASGKMISRIENGSEGIPDHVIGFCKTILKDYKN